MSLFRIGGAAGLRTTRLVAPLNARFASNSSRGTPAVKTNPSEAPTSTYSSSSLISKEGPAEAMTHHQPDYDATIDHGTSYASLPSPPLQTLR
jgi:NADH dehydrogenase (ubiquinone) Fe-S protein 4